jgi:hypothetical protein
MEKFPLLNLDRWIKPIPDFQDKEPVFKDMLDYVHLIGWLLIMPNVRRYVALVQSRGGACFCTRGAMQGYAVITLFSRWQKP